MWIAPIEPTLYENNSLTLSVDGPFALEMLQARLMPNLKRAVEEACGTATEILIVNKKSVKTAIRLPSKSNIKYSFDSFIVGPSNELAFAACKQLADFSGADFNPLYIYSNGSKSDFYKKKISKN